MKLEDEIQQRKFKDEHRKLEVNLIYTGNWIKEQNMRILKKHKLTTQQYNILRILRGQHPTPATVNLLIERMLDKMSNASRLVEKLRLKKLVERRENALDRRQADVVITEKGLEQLDMLDEEMKMMDAKLYTISAEEAAQVNSILDKLRG